MKNLLIALFLFSSLASIAQIQKGTAVVSGNLSFGGKSGSNTVNTTDYSNSSGTFNLIGGYEKFLNEQTALGFGANYSYSNFNSSNGTNDYGRRQHLISIGPKLSHYIPVVNRLYVTIESYVYFGIGGSKEESSDEKYGIWTTGVNVSPGIVLFLNDKWALNAGIGNLYYSYLSEKAKEANSSGEKPKSESHNYGLNLSANSFSIGLRYYLRTATSE